MSNIKYNLITKYTLGVLAIFALSMVALAPQNANAIYCNTSDCGSSEIYYNNNTNNTNPIPSIYSVNPDGANVIAGSMTVTISGANFIPGSMAVWNSSFRPTNYINSNRLTMTLNASDLATPGNYIISVFNPTPGGGNSMNGVYFTVSSATPASVAHVASTYSNNSSNSTAQKANPTVAKTEKKSDANKEKSNTLGLEANALFGANGFLPTGLVQWVVFFILILLMVIIWRRLYVTEEQKREPLKHS